MSPEFGSGRQEYLAESRNRLPEWVEFLRELVNTDSGPADSRGIGSVYELLKDRLSTLEFEFEMHPTPGPPVFHARRNRRQDGHSGLRIVLVGHADTVFPSGTPSSRPMQVEGDRITGPGVADMKGGLVVAIAGLLLGGADALDGLDVEILVNGDEESGSLHSRSVVEEVVAGADAVLVFEPGRPPSGIVTSRRGAHRFDVEVSGVPAHTGVNPDEGANAIETAAHHVLAIQKLGKTTSRGTVNAVMINGGSRPNIVPESAIIRVDSRFDDDAAEQAIVEGMRALEGPGPVAGTATIVTSLDQRPAFPRADAGWLDKFERAAGDLGLDITAEATGGSSDGNFSASLGVPTLDGLGAIGAAYHTDDEFIFTDSLATRSSLLALVLTELGDGDGDGDG